MAKRRSPLSPRIVDADVERRRRERTLDSRADRSRAARNPPLDQPVGRTLSAMEQTIERLEVLRSRDAVQRMTVELRAARSDRDRSDAARSAAAVALAQVHERYAAALDRLRDADVRISVLEAQNALLRLQLGRGDARG